MAGRPPAYRWRGPVLLRASTSPAGLDIPTDLFDGPDSTSATGWLARVWERTEVRNAVDQANPGLRTQIDKVLAGDVTGPKRVRSTVLSVVAYVLRWRRPTPFGLFAGVAPATVGEVPAVRWGDDHRMVARADAEWVADIIGHLHRFPALVERLDVVANNTGHVRGGRLVVPGQSADGHTPLAAPIEVSVRYSAPVAHALDTARTPIRHSCLHEHLNTGFPTAGPERITGLLDQLIDRHLLHTSLWAPMTHTDALSQLCRELDRVGAHDIEEIAHLVDFLRTAHKELTGPLPSTSWPTLAPVAVQMRSFTDVTPTPVIADTGLDAHLQVPPAVPRAVEKAADALIRATPNPFGAPHWRDYHHRFRSSYGPGAVVPVLELVADSGLGWPAGYLGAARKRSPRLSTDRDALFLDLVQHATVQGSGEIILDEDLIARLGPAVGERTTLPPQVEMCVRLHTPTARALAEGDFTLEVGGLPRPGSSLLGRFAHLLPEHEQQLVADSYTHPDPDVLTAQLTFPPRKRRNDNITRTPRFLPHVVPLAQHPGSDAGVIDPADLGVTADAEHLYLLRISTGQRLHLQTAHALETGTQTPPLARFLSEITTARHALYGAFDFGAASRLTYLPRVRYRNTVLAPARWRLPDLRTVDKGEWDRALLAWCKRWRVPERVVLVEQDRRLPLDLDDRVHRQFLQQRRTHHGHLELREDLTPQGASWPGRPHELVFALHRREETPTPPFIAKPAARPVPQLPGSGVLTVDLFAHPDRFDEILTDHLPELVEALPEESRWWFTRHRDLLHPDSDPYLRIHLLTPTDTGTGTVNRLHTWAQGLREQRLLGHLSLTTATSQTGRYGHGPAMDAAQTVFAADTTAALAQIRSTRTFGLPSAALAAASMLRLASDFASTPREGRNWLIALQHTPGPVDRTHRRQAMELVDQTHIPGSDPGGRILARAWDERALALARYREHLATQRAPEAVLRSLLHLHHVRTLGVSPDQEAATIRTARSLALAQRARSPR
ncbi:lantibiotic dehydratase [Nocardiopsis nanhaiensis]